ncbi:MAG: hypothetical protein H6974_13065 [Gammaproteobacteria bacterium]|nr:hypothetical protein [Gammaproteobacteria bacterium]MCP5197695.1 hypothetical protein [Gammaproteobacteria bacterium]
MSIPERICEALADKPLSRKELRESLNTGDNSLSGALTRLLDRGCIERMADKRWRLLRPYISNRADEPGEAPVILPHEVRQVLALCCGNKHKDIVRETGLGKPKVTNIIALLVQDEKIRYVPEKGWLQVGKEPGQVAAKPTAGKATTEEEDQEWMERWNPRNRQNRLREQAGL